MERKEIKKQENPGVLLLIAIVFILIGDWRINLTKEVERNAKLKTEKIEKAKIDSLHKIKLN